MVSRFSFVVGLGAQRATIKRFGVFRLTSSTGWTGEAPGCTGQRRGSGAVPGGGRVPPLLAEPVPPGSVSPPGKPMNARDAMGEAFDGAAAAGAGFGRGPLLAPRQMPPCRARGFPLPFPFLGAPAFGPGASSAEAVPAPWASVCGVAPSEAVPGSWATTGGAGPAALASLAPAATFAASPVSVCWGSAAIPKFRVPPSGELVEGSLADAIEESSMLDTWDWNPGHNA